jgi:hypothetical protein
MNDADNDGVCDELEVLGCMDSLACNFNPVATDAEGVLCVFPVTEICNDWDDDCNGSVDDGLVFSDWFVDQDFDGYGDVLYANSCSDLAVGYSFISGDCNDLDSLINPVALEIPDNNIDENCDGQIPNDILVFDANDWAVYPNPSDGFIQISGLPHAMQIQVFDMQGALLIAKWVQKNERIQLDALDNGMYLIRVGNDFSQRVIIAK